MITKDSPSLAEERFRPVGQRAEAVEKRLARPSTGSGRAVLSCHVYLRSW
jgi:hypothetical protein